MKYEINGFIDEITMNLTRDYRTGGNEPIKIGATAVTDNQRGDIVLILSSKYCADIDDLMKRKVKVTVEII